MIAIAPHMKIFVHVEPVDFRNGLDGLIHITKSKIKEDPFSGAVFLFRNKRAHSVKAIVFDGQGFWLFMKRLSQGRFRHWPEAKDGEAASRRLLSRELSVLLWNGNPERSMFHSDWKKVPN
jgi:transposase